MTSGSKCDLGYKIHISEVTIGSGCLVNDFDSLIGAFQTQGFELNEGRAAAEEVNQDRNITGRNHVQVLQPS